MRKVMYISFLSAIVFSCTTNKKNVYKRGNHTKQVAIQQKTNTATATKEHKPQILHQGNLDFFKENISNPAKNDNTISYGSIVSATPLGFHITKNHFPAVSQGFRQRYIILHYTALDNEASIRVLTQGSVSSHYLINDIDDKEIYQLVDENKRAYHAGISYWRGNNNLNDSSIGIEIVNRAKRINNTEFIFPKFPDFQEKKIGELLKDLVQRYQIPPQNILAHSDIAPSRKQDPGPEFPWKQLYTDYGIGMWYDEQTKDTMTAQLEYTDLNIASNIYKYQSELKDWGYNIEPNGTVDELTKNTITAFQYRFRPSNYNGIMDIETYAILKALLLKYGKK